MFDMASLNVDRECVMVLRHLKRAFQADGLAGRNVRLP